MISESSMWSIKTYDQYLLCGIAFWNKDTLEKIKVMNTPLKLSGQTHIEKDFLYISSRNISGIDRINLKE